MKKATEPKNPCPRAPVPQKLAIGKKPNSMPLIHSPFVEYNTDFLLFYLNYYLWHAVARCGTHLL